MKEQGFGFEPEAAQPAQHPGGHIMTYFEFVGLTRAQEQRALPFRELAYQMVEWLPPGTVRSQLLERLLDIRETCVKAAK